MEELQDSQQEIDIFVCTESWLTEGKNINFPGFNIFRMDRTHASGGGILICLKKNLTFKRLNDILSPDDSIEICGLNICNLNPALNLIVCYRSPGSTLSENIWEKIVGYTQKHKNCILMRDFNAHHVTWNSTNNDTNGKNFHEALENSDLFLLNPDSYTRMDLYRNKKSNLDLIFSSAKLADKITTKIHDETWGSDHFPIFVNINIEKYLYYQKNI